MANPPIKRPGLPPKSPEFKALAPRGQNVLIFPEAYATGGILIPEVAKDSMQSPLVTIMAVGPDCDDLEVGDKCVVGNLRGIPFKVGGKECILVDQGFLLAKVPNGLTQ